MAAAGYPNIKIAVSGGKGGTGKTVLAANVGVVLSQLGYRVVVIDADFSGANLHTVFGLHHPSYTLGQYVQSRIPPENLLINTGIKDLWVVCGDQGSHSFSNLSFNEIAKIASLPQYFSADFIIFDLGAGSHKMATDLFSIADVKISVLTVEPTSLENCYGMIKNALVRLFYLNMAPQSDARKYFLHLIDPHKSGAFSISELLARHSIRYPEYADLLQKLHARYFTGLILNRVSQNSQLQILKNFQDMISRFLNINPIALGYIVEDPRMAESVMRCTPLAVFAPECRATQCIRMIGGNVVKILGKKVY